MSADADVLRRAATDIRRDVADELHSPGDVAAWLAVADLLDEVAVRWAYVEERELAFAVARAYLGEESS